MPYASDLSLTQQDLIMSEDRIRQELASMLSFSSALIYFPRRPPEGTHHERHGYMPHYIPEERKLLLPLILYNKFLGVMVLKDVSPGHGTEHLPYVMHAMRFLLHGLVLEKRAHRDPLTGLADEKRILGDMAREIELIRSSFQRAHAQETEFEESGSRVQLGLLFLDVDRMRGLNSDYGYDFGDLLLQEIASALQAVFQEQCVVGRIKDDVFAVLCPGWSPAGIRSAAEQMKKNLASLVLTVPVTEEKVRPSVSITCCCYPQDMPGSGFRARSAVQARHLLDSCMVAVERIKQLGGGGCYSWSDILHRAGRVVETRTPQTVLVNVGSRLGAGEGQVFGIIESPGSPMEGETGLNQGYKAEVLLLDVNREESVGEILFLHDPTVDVKVGDRLVLLHDGEDEGSRFDGAQGLTPERIEQAGPKLPDYGQFLRAWPSLRRKHDSFALLLCQCGHGLEEVRGSGFLRRIAESPAAAGKEETFFAQYGSSCLVVFLPETTSQAALETAGEIYSQLADGSSQPVWLGAAVYPCLHFDRGDILANARKALEHAKLSKEPHIALFDSVSLTISADRFFTQGHLADAIREYKTALLMDPGNTTARNSLGICYARSGDPGSAAAEFRSVLHKDPENTIALYNLGSVHWKAGDESKAAECYERCCELDPEQPFSLLRLGLIMERRGDLDKAAELYGHAAELPGGESSSQRHLAGLDLRAGRSEEARSRLHKVLSGNPRDAEGLYMLARLYLQQGEDVELAESMAKQSVALRPAAAKYVRLLEDVLAKQDKRKEIAALRARLARPAPSSWNAATAD
jgi:diguanylate cyclase (GGDEF)-like protein